MSTSSIPTEQASVVLEYVQGKRRLTRVLETASTLLQRVSEEPERARRLETSFELIRRHFSADVCLEFDGVVLRATSDAPAADADPVCRFTIEGADGASGRLDARYTSPGTLGLTPAEWPGVMLLLARITALSVGGRIV
ncbi:hypothetical protein [Streptomyces purpurogeneiscleroticus]|uniref:hypothetical protein n=1 Tax=Streptomyces purpurogeneiscleroticus TaxID=68259 RepID=UPI001CBAE18A|nr:hypothetical protein [Streptomyces purpurogeneiscleroticus]MBZ4019500.1 hypothetical protein [Streptomyces purpurogeneiscleroticus]